MMAAQGETLYLIAPSSQCGTLWYDWAGVALASLYSDAALLLPHQVWHGPHAARDRLFSYRARLADVSRAFVLLVGDRFLDRRCFAEYIYLAVERHIPVLALTTRGLQPIREVRRLYSNENQQRYAKVVIARQVERLVA